MMKKILGFITMGMMAVTLLLLVDLPVQAGMVEPSGEKDNTDVRRINAELEDTGSVTLKKGGTYYLQYYISLNSHNSIDATGAKIIVNKGAVRNAPYNYKKDYSSMTDVKIKGGTWVSEDKKGCPGTSFSFAHCQNIRLSNMNILCTNAEGHAVELVACKNVTIDKCKIIAQGKGKSNSVEEMVQIDLAAPKSAPFLESKFQNGLACKNITVSGCTILGNRGVGANFAKSDKKYIKKYHNKVIIKNNTITGTTSEALSLFNTINAQVYNNKIITKSKRVNDSHSVGCHIAVEGNIPSFAKGKITVKNNVIKGGRQGFFLCSHSKTRYGSLVIKKNKLYCKKKKADALKVAANSKGKRSAKKVKNSGNKLYKWK